MMYMYYYYTILKKSSAYHRTLFLWLNNLLFSLFNDNAKLGDSNNKEIQIISELDLYR